MKARGEIKNDDENVETNGKKNVEMNGKKTCYEINGREASRRK